MMEENKIILYKDKEGKVNVNVRFADEDVWLTREHLAEIYATTPQNISLHVGNIYQDQEMSEEGTRKKFFLVRQEGKRQVKREIDHYNLDMIIALGYRGRRQELLYPHETRISSSDDFSRLISCLIQF
jgi:hypothetical protein